MAVPPLEGAAAVYAPRRGGARRPGGPGLRPRDLRPRRDGARGLSQLRLGRGWRRAAPPGSYLH